VSLLLLVQARDGGVLGIPVEREKEQGGADAERDQQGREPDSSQGTEDFPPFSARPGGIQGLPRLGNAPETKNPAFRPGSRNR
jgi:protein-L-isoaspartate O-methyltransferase